MTGSSTTDLVVGKRYINTKTRQPLTLLYIGPLPPNDTGETSGPSASSIWLGVEYDDPSQGKGHSGIYNNTQIFRTRQEGAGAFIKYKTGTELQEGKTFVQAINERYALGGGMESVILGSSNAVVVEAPGMDAVSKRLRKLERLRQIGLEDELICGVGGSDEERETLGSRLNGVKMLNISRNLIHTWEEVEGIMKVVGGVTTLIMNDSRLDPKTSSGQSQAQMKELHLARSLLTWSEVDHIMRRFNGLEELHLSGNTSLAEIPIVGGLRSESLRFLSLDECGIQSWALVEEVAKGCSNLETLNLSSNPLEPIPKLSETPPLEALKSLILLENTLDSLASLVHLSHRVPQLENLRFSLHSSIPASAEKGSRLSGNDEEDRGLLLVLFTKLVMLNGNGIKPKEREEAERRFCTRHTTFEEPILQALYERLSKKHGLQSLAPSIPEKTSLRSKMITLHVYPPSSDPFTLPLLPTAPITMMKRKIAKKLNAGVDRLKLWTVKRIQSENIDESEEVWDRAKVMEVEEGEIGFWFDDGDGVIVDID